MSAEQLERVTVHFSGRVQGVGFRYTARQIARNFNVTGSVRNLSNGQVKLILEGDRTVIDKFIKTIQTNMSRYITNMNIDIDKYTESYSSFEVEH